MAVREAITLQLPQSIDIVQHMHNNTCVTKNRQHNAPRSIQPSEFFSRGFVETTVGAAAVCQCWEIVETRTDSACVTVEVFLLLVYEADSWQFQ